MTTLNTARAVRILLALVLVAAMAILTVGVQPTAYSDLLDNEVATGSAEAEVAYMPAGEMVEFEPLAAPPEVSEEELARREAILDMVNLPGPDLPMSDAVVEGPQGGETDIDADVDAPGSFKIMINKRLKDTISGASMSNVNEPAAGQAGKYVWYTGNWYAAFSNGYGGWWYSYRDPYADFPDFCCDQDVIYDPSRNVIFWLRMGVPDGNGENRFKLGVSKNGGASFCTYTTYPTNVNSGWTNQWWDYPRMVLSNDFVYMAWNMFDQAGYWSRTVMLRWPLDSLRNCAGFSYNYINWTSQFNFTPVNGATETMYWGTHYDTDTFRLFSWAEDSGSYNWYDRSIPAWTSTPRYGAHCPGPDGNDACQRLDHRVISGWVTKGVIGFFWNVKEGAGFNYPYSNAATFNESDKSYIGRPYIFNSSYAWIYPDIYPNARGDLGMSVIYAGGSYHPSSAMSIDDDFNGAPPGWEVKATQSGTNGPYDDKWGDYVRVRPHTGGQRAWMATAFTLQGGTSGGYTDPHFVIFGRERDEWSVWRWWRN